MRVHSGERIRSQIRFTHKSRRISLENNNSETSRTNHSSSGQRLDLRETSLLLHLPDDSNLDSIHTFLGSALIHLYLGIRVLRLGFLPHIQTKEEITTAAQNINHSKLRPTHFGFLLNPPSRDFLELVLVPIKRYLPVPRAENISFQPTTSH